MRIKSLDLARGYIVLCIPAVHSILLYSQPSVRDTFAGQCLRFIAEGPGAQLFMTYMGISMTLSSNLNWNTILRRSFIFLVAAYGLNLFKFVLPLKLGLLPATFKTDLGITNPCTAGETVFLIGDILHFAALALPITYSIYKLRRYWVYALAAVISVTLFSPFFWHHYSCSPVIDYFFRLVGGAPPAVYFPLFPWLTYPLAGLVIGHWLRCDMPDKFLFIGLMGITLILIGVIGSLFDQPSTSFYCTRPADTLVHLGIVCIWLWIWDVCSNFVRSNAFFRLLQYASRSITMIYLIQWPLICWCLPIFGYQHLSYWPSMMTAFLMTGLTLFFSLLIQASTTDGVVIEH